MKHKKVVSYKYLPTRFPITLTILTWMVLDKVNAPGFFRGISWTLVAIVWIASVVESLREEDSEPEWKK